MLCLLRLYRHNMHVMVLIQTDVARDIKHAASITSLPWPRPRKHSPSSHFCSLFTGLHRGCLCCNSVHDGSGTRQMRNKSRRRTSI